MEFVEEKEWKYWIERKKEEKNNKVSEEYVNRRIISNKLERKERKKKKEELISWEQDQHGGTIGLTTERSGK